MAIIACSACGKKISSHTPICSHCGLEIGEVSEEQLEIFRTRKLRDRLYHLSMISYSVITVFVAAFGWFWLDSEGFEHRSSVGPFILMGLAAVAYLLIRILQFRNRRRQKAMRQKRLLRSKLRQKS
jgi:hypothetical protein